MPLHSFSWLLMAAVLLLSACSRDVVISTELPVGANLRPGDTVVLDERELGTVSAIEVTPESNGMTVEISLHPEYAELVQSNAVAFASLEGPPALVLANPSETAAAVASGTRLRGLSAFEAAIWSAGNAAEVFSGIIDQFGQSIINYLESDEWAQTQSEIDAEIAKLAADSQRAAESVAEELKDLFDSINDRAAENAQLLADELTTIKEEIERLEAEGHEQLVAALRRLLEQIEALTPKGQRDTPPDRGDPPENRTVA